jgi:hypothetical protein
VCTVGITPDGGTVSTHAELVEWLVRKHAAVQTVTLPFEGANVAVYCVEY